MSKYSIFSLVRNAISYHENWGRRVAQPRAAAESTMR